MRVFIASVCAALVLAGPAFSQSQTCSRQDISRLERAFFAQMNEQASQIVWFGSDKSATLRYCDRYSDGFVVQGRFHLYGLDGAYYWLDGRMVTNRSYGPRGSEVVDANANFQILTIAKVGSLLALATGICASDPTAC